MLTYDVCISRACALVNLARSMWYYKPKRDDSEVVAKLNELAESHPTRGFDNYYSRIRNEGIVWNRKKVLRVYRLMRLKLRRKRKRRLPARKKEALLQPLHPNQSWSMDFMSDALTNGRRIRLFNVIDDYNREALCIDPQFSYPAEFVVRSLERLAYDRALPKQIRVDNGPEFTSQVFQDFCLENEITIKYIQPGKPVQNAYVERFNRTLREDVLDAYLFNNIRQVRKYCKEFQNDYNETHPHNSLAGLSPRTFALFQSNGNLPLKMNKNKITTSLKTTADNNSSNDVFFNNLQLS